MKPWSKCQSERSVRGCWVSVVWCGGGGEWIRGGKMNGRLKRQEREPDEGHGGRKVERSAGPSARALGCGSRRRRVDGDVAVTTSCSSSGSMLTFQERWTLRDDMSVGQHIGATRLWMISTRQRCVIHQEQPCSVAKTPAEKLRPSTPPITPAPAIIAGLPRVLAAGAALGPQ